MRLFAYDSMGGGGASADLGAPSGGDPANAPSPGSDGTAREDTFFMPAEFPGSEDYKPGDTIQLRVVGKDSGGRMEVECVHDEEKKSFGDDMRESLASTPGQQPEGGM